MSLLLLLLACARPPAALLPTGAPEPARVGLRFQAVPEGLLVTEVIDGMGAARAGLAVGDLIVEVEGDSAVGLSADEARARLQGPAGTAVAVRAAAPLGGESRALELRRGLDPTPRAQDGPGAAKQVFQKALLRGDEAEAARATEALVAANYDGEAPADAVGRALMVAMRDRPAVGRAAIDTLVARARWDARLHATVGEAYLRAEDDALAVIHLREAERTRARDVTDGSWSGDVGGAIGLRSSLALALWGYGQREAAAEVARTLARTVDVPTLYGELGLAPYDRGAQWRGALEPLGALQTTLLDGAPWSLQARPGQVTLLAFWASWCGPCREELPHLQALWSAYRDQGFEVLAVSVDRAEDRDKAEQAARKLGLEMPLAHEPGWSGRFDVGSIPSLRLVGRDGAIRYSSHGYSPAGISNLEREIKAALSDEAAAGAPLGKAWTTGIATLSAFVPLRAARDLWTGEGRLVLGVESGAPLVVAAEDVVTGWTSLPTPDVGEAARAVGGRVAWLDGPVAADLGRPLLRAWDEEGAARWMVTTPGPVEDLAVVGQELWVATETELLRLDAAGKLLSRLAVAGAHLAPEADGAWVLHAQQLSWLGTKDTDLQPRRSALDGAVVGSGGLVATPVAHELLAGRFGPDGARRVVVARADGAVVGLDGAGAPAFTLMPTGSEAEVHLAAWDPDGDGHDQLVLALEGRGLAVVELALP